MSERTKCGWKPHAKFVTSTLFHNSSIYYYLYFSGSLLYGCEASTPKWSVRSLMRKFGIIKWVTIDIPFSNSLLESGTVRTWSLIYRDDMEIIVRRGIRCSHWMDSINLTESSMHVVIWPKRTNQNSSALVHIAENNVNASNTNKCTGYSKLGGWAKWGLCKILFKSSNDYTDRGNTCPFTFRLQPFSATHSHSSRKIVYSVQCGTMASISDFAYI